MKLGAANKIFGKSAAGAAFQVYAPVKFKRENEEALMHNWNFAVKPGDEIGYSWPLAQFEQGRYHLLLHGANGFFREYKGDGNDALTVKLLYTKGQEYARLVLTNKGTATTIFEVNDPSYGTGTQKMSVKAGASIEYKIPLLKTGHWYDVVIRKAANFLWRFAGKIETGKSTITDPLMGKALS